MNSTNNERPLTPNEHGYVALILQSIAEHLARSE